MLAHVPREPTVTILECRFNEITHHPPEMVGEEKGAHTCCTYAPDANHIQKYTECHINKPTHHPNPKGGGDSVNQSEDVSPTRCSVVASLASPKRGGEGDFMKAKL